MKNFFILDRKHPLDVYCKDIEIIYTSNGWGKSYPTELVKKMYANCYYLLAMHGNSAIGVVRAFTDNVTVTHLSEVIVEKRFHGRGAGSALLTMLITDLGHTTVYTEALNTQAGILFEKNGFQRKPKLTVYARRANAEP